MANVFSAILPSLQAAVYKVPRESSGFINACFRNSSETRAGLNQPVKYPIQPKMTTGSVSPSNVSSTGTDITTGSGTIVMDQLRKTSWNWEGEAVRALQTGDIAPYADMFSQTFENAVRALVNEIENTLWLEAYRGASRAFGTAGTTPFATAADFSDFAGVARILDENGCPNDGNRCLVLGHAAVQNLRAKQSNLFKVNEAGDAAFLRTGSLGQIMGFDLFNSHPIGVHTKGTGASYQTNSTGLVADGTAIPVDTGSGTILAGDIVTFAADSANKYVVGSALASGSFTLNRPGLRVAIADNNAVTVGNNYTPNVAFHRDALHLVARQPDDGMDGAQEVAAVTDPQTGLVFQLARYGQYMQSSWELRILYGVKAVESEFIATLIG